MIRLIIFDGEGVLYSGKKAMKIFKKEYEKFLKKFRVRFKEQEKIWLKFYPKISSGKISLREANRIIYKKFRIPCSKVDEWLKKDKEIILKYVKLYKNRKKVLEKVKSKGIKIAILSDTVHPLRWRLELFAKLGLKKGKHYDKLFLSNLLGYEKPHPKSYLKVLKYFEVKPEETLFVGHDKEEMKGAENVGIKAVFWKEFQKYLRK
ncbi:MAG: HAD-IA family hydrolase [Candidatus Aenigmarchaeota archaeon]|nr:HAD-IA family hydrolase [Candidatus Aenigmarchaeota archaeon]